MSIEGIKNIDDWEKLGLGCLVERVKEYLVAASIPEQILTPSVHGLKVPHFEGKATDDPKRYVAMAVGDMGDIGEGENFLLTSKMAFLLDRGCGQVTDWLSTGEKIAGTLRGMKVTNGDLVCLSYVTKGEGKTMVMTTDISGFTSLYEVFCRVVNGK